MRFESSLHSYEIINLLLEKESYCVFLCIEKREQYFLICVKSDALKSVCARNFLGWYETGEFDGICEVFTQGEDLVGVFHAFALSESLTAYLDEEAEYTTTEKFTFLHQILGGLCLHHVPVQLACDLIYAGNLGVKLDGCPDCRYQLEQLDCCFAWSMEEFTAAFLKTVRLIFEEEFREKKNAFALSSFCKELEQHPPEDMMALFVRYDTLYRELEGGKRLEENQNHRRQKKLLQILKKGVAVLKRVLALALIGVAVWILICALQTEKKNTGGSYEKIGDVVIEEYVDTE